MSDVWMHIGTGIVPTTSSGTVDVMGPTGMGTPKAVLVMMMAPKNATADDGTFIANNAMESFGACDNVEQWCCSVGIDNGSTTSINRRVYHTDAVLNAVNVTSTTAPYTEMSAMGGSAGPITDGWRFETVLDITNADRYFRVLFIGGEDCEVDCLGTKTLSAVIDTATDVTEPGFEPDIVFFGSSHVSTDGYTLTDDANMSTGIAFNDTANRNKGLSYFAEHNIGTTDNTMVQWSNGVGGLLDGTTTKVYGIDIDNYDSNGFDVSPRGAGGQSDYFGYLAMRDKTGTSNYWLDDINSPNNTTVDWDTYNTTLGFQPTLLMIWGLNTYLEDTINDAIAYSKGYYLADADTVMTMNQHNEDDSAWSDVGNEKTFAVLRRIVSATRISGLPEKT